MTGGNLLIALFACFCAAALGNPILSCAEGQYMIPGGYGCHPCYNCEHRGRSVERNCTHDRNKGVSHDTECGGCLPTFYNRDYKGVIIWDNSMGCTPCSYDEENDPDCDEWREHYFTTALDTVTTDYQPSRENSTMGAGAIVGICIAVFLFVIIFLVIIGLIIFVYCPSIKERITDALNRPKAGRCSIPVPTSGETVPQSPHDYPYPNPTPATTERIGSDSDSNQSIDSEINTETAAVTPVTPVPSLTYRLPLDNDGNPRVLHNGEAETAPLDADTHGENTQPLLPHSQPEQTTSIGIDSSIETDYGPTSTYSVDNSNRLVECSAGASDV